MDENLESAPACVEMLPGRFIPNPALQFTPRVYRHTQCGTSHYAVEETTDAPIVFDTSFGHGPSRVNFDTPCPVCGELLARETIAPAQSVCLTRPGAVWGALLCLALVRSGPHGIGPTLDLLPQ